MNIKYICPTCNEEIRREAGAIIEHTDIHIVDAIKKLIQNGQRRMESEKRVMNGIKSK